MTETYSACKYVQHSSDPSVRDEHSSCAVCYAETRSRVAQEQGVEHAPRARREHKSVAIRADIGAALVRVEHVDTQRFRERTGAQFCNAAVHRSTATHPGASKSSCARDDRDPYSSPSTRQAYPAARQVFCR